METKFSGSGGAKGIAISKSSRVGGEEGEEGGVVLGGTVSWMRRRLGLQLTAVLLQVVSVYLFFCMFVYLFFVFFVCVFLFVVSECIWV